MLVDWVKEVSREAQERDKVLIASSHYPIIEFYNITLLHKEKSLLEDLRDFFYL